MISPRLPHCCCTSIFALVLLTSFAAPLFAAKGGGSSSSSGGGARGIPADFMNDLMHYAGEAYARGDHYEIATVAELYARSGQADRATRVLDEMQGKLRSAQQQLHSAASLKIPVEQVTEYTELPDSSGAHWFGASGGGSPDKLRERIRIARNTYSYALERTARQLKLALDVPAYTAATARWKEYLLIGATDPKQRANALWPLLRFQIQEGDLRGAALTIREIAEAANTIPDAQAKANVWWELSEKLEPVEQARRERLQAAGMAFTVLAQGTTLVSEDIPIRAVLLFARLGEAQVAEQAVAKLPQRPAAFDAATAQGLILAGQTDAAIAKLSAFDPTQAGDEYVAACIKLAAAGQLVPALDLIDRIPLEPAAPAAPAPADDLFSSTPTPTTPTAPPFDGAPLRLRAWQGIFDAWNTGGKIDEAVQGTPLILARVPAEASAEVFMRVRQLVGKIVEAKRRDALETVLGHFSDAAARDQLRYDALGAIHLEGDEHVDLISAFAAASEHAILKPFLHLRAALILASKKQDAAAREFLHSGEAAIDAYLKICYDDPATRHDETVKRLNPAATIWGPSDRVHAIDRLAADRVGTLVWLGELDAAEKLASTLTDESQRDAALQDLAAAHGKRGDWTKAHAIVTRISKDYQRRWAYQAVFRPKMPASLSAAISMARAAPENVRSDACFAIAHAWLGAQEGNK